MIDEIVIEDGVPTIHRVRLVAVTSYGSEGCTPVHRDDCPLEGAVSCVSGSGDSICGGFFGHAGTYVVRCQEKLK
jgi:hypothetical protein